MRYCDGCTLAQSYTNTSHYLWVTLYWSAISHSSNIERSKKIKAVWCTLQSAIISKHTWLITAHWFHQSAKPSRHTWPGDAGVNAAAQRRIGEHFSVPFNHCDRVPALPPFVFAGKLNNAFRRESWRPALDECHHFFFRKVRPRLQGDGVGVPGIRTHSFVSRIRAIV